MAGKAYAVRVRSDRARPWGSKRPLLIRLDIELTERCNNDCVHCNVNLPAGDEEARGREMKTDFAKRIVEEAAALGCLTVRFTGGEPLLREDFEDIYLFTRKLGLKVLLFTNATLLSPRLVGLLKKVPPLEPVEVSVYGMKKESAEAVTRNPGAFDAARRGLGLLAESGLPFVLKGALLPATKGEVEEFECFAQELPGADGPPSYAMLFDLRSRRDGVKNDLIRSLRIDPREFIQVSARPGPEAFVEWKALVLQFSDASGDRLFDCLEAGGTGSVDAYGRFQCCLGLRHPETVYSLEQGSLREAMTVFLPAVRAKRAVNKDYLERCGLCRLRSLCHQCPAKSWAEHGTLDSPVEYFCRIAHAQAAAIGLIEAGEKTWEVADWPGRLRRLAASVKDGEAPGRRVRKECQGRDIVKDAIRMDAAYGPSEDIVAREIEGEVVIVPLVSGIGDLEDELYTLNETGRAIWRKLDGLKRVREMVRELAEEFEAPPVVIEADVVGLLEELLKRKMVVEKK